MVYSPYFIENFRHIFQIKFINIQELLVLSNLEPREESDHVLEIIQCENFWPLEGLIFSLTTWLCNPLNEFSVVKDLGKSLSHT